ncbi:MAG: bifunctional hydroxymethylpyrimidine kinase/phosphomethylpyrimidine kinase [Gemmatimonadales bacterium]
MKIALTVAGSDSGGCAGIQADLKTFHQFGVFGTSVVTAVTAQNTQGVFGIHQVPVPTIAAQLDAVLSDLAPHAVKTGMLATVEIVESVAAKLADRRVSNYVLDPVVIASSGERLLDADAESRLRETLVPLATLVTPNLAEAAILVERSVRTIEQMERAGRTLLTMGAGAALITGGHLTGNEIVDVLVIGDATQHFTHGRIDTTSTHGTGCTLSASVAAGLALGADVATATAHAVDFVQRALASAPLIGRGRGPLNHFVDAGSEA